MFLCSNLECCVAEEVGDKRHYSGLMNMVAIMTVNSTHVKENTIER